MAEQGLRLTKTINRYYKQNRQCLISVIVSYIYCGYKYCTDLVCVNNAVMAVFDIDIAQNKLL